VVVNYSSDYDVKCQLDTCKTYPVITDSEREDQTRCIWDTKALWKWGDYGWKTSRSTSYCFIVYFVYNEWWKNQSKEVFSGIWS